MGAGLGGPGAPAPWARPDPTRLASRRVIPRLFPKYIRAPNGPEANPVKQLQPSEWGGGGGGELAPPAPRWP